MRLRAAAIFPTTEVGAADAGALRAYAQAVQDLGFVELVAYDHVINASAVHYPEGSLLGSYRERHSFREPFVLFGFLAGVAPKLSFTTNVLVLPQRQTVLVAKQAAEVDVLCGGRLTLGVGIGWNGVEYESLGVPFKQRAARLEEQVRLMRELWTKPIVSFSGRFHKVVEAGLNPLPLQRPIPIWFGGMAEPVLKRVATIGDGWLPAFPSMVNRSSRAMPKRIEPPAEIVARLHGYAREAGRDPASIPMAAALHYGSQTPEEWHRNTAICRSIGVGTIQFNTMDAGLLGVDAHIAALRKFADEMKEVFDDHP